MNEKMPWSELPGADLVRRGLQSLADGRLDEPALAVLIARRRLCSLGLVVPDLAEIVRDPELALYIALQNRLPEGAHAAFNAIRRELVSFADSWPSIKRPRP